MPSAPFEIVSGPVTLYLADAGTAAPEISADPPSATWDTLGTNGDKNYSEDGVTVTPEQTLEYQMVLGSTGRQKAFRTEESLMVSVNLLDVSAEALAKAMNDATVATAAAGAGTGGHRSFDLLRGEEVTEFALLAKGYSPYADNMSAQFWIPKCVVETTGELPYVKGAGAAMEIVFSALDDATSGFGKYYAQDADPV